MAEHRAKGSGEVLDGEDARVLANTLRMANETAEKLLVERAVLRGALNRVIDEGVVNWHDASDDTRHVHEALGLTFEQYAAWVERDWAKFVKACPE